MKLFDPRGANMMRRSWLAIALMWCWGCLAQAAADEFDAQLATLQRGWAEANYATSDATARQRAFEALTTQAQQLTAQFPDRAEALIWQGIVLSTYAGVKGGLGALGLAKKSRAALERALQMNPMALEGSAYTSLGALYGKVPGFPIGFGNDKTARTYLLKALEINPGGIDPNYFYADFLVDEKQYAQARTYLQKALQAAPRPGRELADQGRRKEIDGLLKRIDALER